MSPMHPARHRRLALLIAASLLVAGLPGSAPAVRAATAGVTVDLSLGNGIASGAVVNPDPAHALVTATNGYHFWAGLDLQAPTGAAQLAPATLSVDARGVYGTLGLIGPGATSAWAGTFGSGGGSQAVWIHYDLATPGGAQALALTCLTIMADTFGSPLLAPSAAAVQHAVTLITDLAPFTDLLAAVQSNRPWAIAQAWSLLLQSAPGRAAIIEALAELGVVSTDAGLKALGSVVGLIHFAQTMVDLLRAGLGGHTSGQVTFAVAGAGGTPTATGSARPSSGVFTPTGSMETARESHSATLLPDGRVLIAGGWKIAGGNNGNSGLASAELYDPRSGTFTPAGDMTTARTGHTATLLPNGRVLIAGGNNGNSGLASADLYDPGSGTFTPAGDMTTARTNHTATLLPNGRVLIAGGLSAGGSNNGSILASAELYDPGSGTFTPTGDMTTARYGHTATLLPNGRVLIAAGDLPRASAELYDPASGTFTPTRAMTAMRIYHTATLLPNGHVLMAGGGASTDPTSAELYEPASGTFIPTRAMTAAQEGHTATLLANGRVLIAGGWNVSGGDLAFAELYDPASGTFTATGAMTATRDFHTATLLPDGRVLIVGGGDPVLASAELFR